MKYIKKEQPPQTFTHWKAQENEDWKPHWDNFRGKEKFAVHNTLLKEQGYICCYCGRRISSKTSHIEHLKPRTNYPNLALEYGNLLASCQGESEEPPPIPVHCGHKKKDWYDKQLMVSPLDNNCADFFRFTEAGEILPKNDPDKQAAITTIERLGLNIDKLKKMRKKAIEAILDVIEKEEIEALIKGFETPDLEGKYEEFSGALIYILGGNR
ncbi:MAG: TIGR02646 family protein [Gomphosphaeria aponina SAG 52.96 = DSM 107014]|uniref:TIGR02646 family protein n=1 Tax=Gomphosphaeria aponina SAG 52.96 = DSM 107014 TaxID=1521640 RepID=A0A941GR91_9CHRO|nr:TIGR02646 family protein [Gomphosphaeria aponina SAG 52.96 = DSM 107014]